MDYQAMYQQKLTTAQEAVKVVKSGDWVDYTWCTNHPVALDKALAERKDELTDVKIRGGVTMSMPLQCQECQVKWSPASSALAISGIHMVTPPRTFTSCSSSLRAARALSRATGWLVHQV